MRECIVAHLLTIMRDTGRQISNITYTGKKDRFRSLNKKKKFLLPVICR